jgi:hypothetical protein
MAGHPLALCAAEAVRLGLFYVSLSLAYIAAYSAIEAESATLAIVSYVEKAGAAGATDADLTAQFGRATMLMDRLALMESGGWVRCEGADVALTAEGRFFAEMFERAARFFGLAKGG